MIKDQSECESIHSITQKLHNSSSITEIESAKCYDKSNNLPLERNSELSNTYNNKLCNADLINDLTNKDSQTDIKNINDIRINNANSQKDISESAASFYRSSIIGCGSYLPEKIVTNADLEKILDTNNQWIIERTGIEQRRVASPNQNTSDLAVEAAKMAIQNSGIDTNSIDMIIVATTTPDHTFPATSTLVQKKLGIKNCISFDVQAVCSGFIFALTTADMYIKTGMIKTALVIGAETLSRIVDPNDRSTAILFADGAGAFILQSNAYNSGTYNSNTCNSDAHNSDKCNSEAHNSDSCNSMTFSEFSRQLLLSNSNTFNTLKTNNAKSNTDNNSDSNNTSSSTTNLTCNKFRKDSINSIPSGIIESVLHTDGAGYDLLKTSGGPSAGNGPGVILMEGQAVFKRAVEELSSVISELLNKTPFESKDIDWFIPHQANKRIIYAAAKAIGLDESKIVYTGNKHANTSAASVPLAFHEAFKSGLIKSGDIVLFESFGAGFSWGATLVKL